MKEDEKFMRLALEKAKEGIDKGQSPFGACIVKHGKVIACEHNVVVANTDITAHAEIHAIRKACKQLNTIDLSGCVIYSTCEPCPMCFAACHWAKISRIVFGATIEDSKQFGFHELTISNDVMKRDGNSRLDVVGNFMRRESIELFEHWAKREDRVIY